MKYTLLILIAIQSSCGNNVDYSVKFVVPEYNEMYLKDSIKYPTYDYYSPNNIILTELTKVIYYHDNWTSCGTGWQVTNPPRKIDFEKSPLLVFENIESLISTISHPENSQKIIMLASNSDNIINPLYFELKSRIRKTKNMYIISTRKITADEENAIKNNFTIKVIDNKR